jgi:hypothetical protein
MRQQPNMHPAGQTEQELWQWLTKGVYVHSGSKFAASLEAFWG